MCSIIQYGCIRSNKESASYFFSNTPHVPPLLWFTFLISVAFNRHGRAQCPRHCNHDNSSRRRSSFSYTCPTTVSHHCRSMPLRCRFQRKNWFLHIITIFFFPSYQTKIIIIIISSFFPYLPNH